MRVLHLITGLGAGGAEQQLRLLLRHLPGTGDVVTLTNPGAVADGIRADGGRVRCLGMRGNRDLTALPRLVRLLRGGRYDVVHTHLYRACVYGRLAARLAGVRTVLATEHSLGRAAIEGRPLTPGVRALYLATERLGSATVAVSSTVAERLRAWGVPAHRIHLVPNGIDAAALRHDPAVRAATRARLGLPADATVVGGVGRLVPGKRFDTLLRACAALPGIRLLLVGDGPERPRLARLAEELGMAGRLHLTGECAGAVAGAPGTGPDGRPALPGLLAAMDLCVSPSTEEAFGLSVLEALAAGLPVLYVTCPAVEEMPRSAAPGAVRVAPGTAALTAALRVHLAGGTPRLPVPSVVGRYDIARSAARLQELYRLLAGRPGARGAPHPPAPAPAHGPAHRPDLPTPHTAPPTTTKR
ncbi:glycosyltransferase [Streptomyces sp. JJ36]|uniref:glycosyltransferase n=1 Tax=Streptomyces sp. JJ36 TaxID=2736645 RepID=UPI001F457C7A|nr:glycosyltransferase [Streptomyces sp. JJ36]MCF6526107.1 glycosyltransferase [Streptomyces sp. JJ36]